MANFTKENLVVSGDYVHYVDTAGKSTFVARCKYGRDKGSFVSFLKKNFTVEEYFTRLNAGEYPLPILQSKGYIQSHIKKWLKDAGLPVNAEGVKILMVRK